MTEGDDSLMVKLRLEGIKVDNRKKCRQAISPRFKDFWRAAAHSVCSLQSTFFLEISRKEQYTYFSHVRYTIEEKALAA